MCATMLEMSKTFANRWLHFSHESKSFRGVKCYRAVVRSFSQISYICHYHDRNTFGCICIARHDACCRKGLHIVDFLFYYGLKVLPQRRHDCISLMNQFLSGQTATEPSFLLLVKYSVCNVCHYYDTYIFRSILMHDTILVLKNPCGLSISLYSVSNWAMHD